MRHLTLLFVHIFRKLVKQMHTTVIRLQFLLSFFTMRTTGVTQFNLGLYVLSFFTQVIFIEY